MELNPQQIQFLSYYTDPNSETFGNAKQSALKAKYSEEYAQNITGQMPEWLSDNISRIKSLRKAEKNLEEVQGLSIKDPTTGRVISDVLRERNKVDIFVAETLGRASYSKRSELSGPDGGPVQFIDISKQLEKVYGPGTTKSDDSDVPDEG